MLFPVAGKQQNITFHGYMFQGDICASGPAPQFENLTHLLGSKGLGVGSFAEQTTVGLWCQVFWSSFLNAAPSIQSGG